MIRIYKPRISGIAVCKECREKIFQLDNPVCVDTTRPYVPEKWFLHGDCFTHFRERVKRVNIFKLQERD